MATPATTCPNCAEPLTAATNVCPRCGYHVTAAPTQQTDQPQDQVADADAGVAGDASPTAISYQQTQSHPPTDDPSPTAHYPSAGPVVPTAPTAMPAAMPTAMPDQETARIPSVALTPFPQAISPTTATVTQATLAPHAR